MKEVPSEKSLDLGDDQPVNGVYVALVTIEGGYVYSDSHQFFTSITNIVGTSSRITTPVVTGRVFKGDLVVFTAVSGTEIGAIVAYRQSANDNSTWRLVLYEDTGIVGLPMTSNGGNIIVKWSDQGIFGL